MPTRMQVFGGGYPQLGWGSTRFRYMHTPVEMVSVKDIQRVGRLLAEFIASLEADFVDTIIWE